MKDTIEVVTTVKVSRKEIIDHIAGSGAFGYPWYHDLILGAHGFTVSIDDPAQDEGVPMLVKISYQAFAEIMAKKFAMYQCGVTYGVTSYDLDADAVDWILQECIFGGQVYG